MVQMNIDIGTLIMACFDLYLLKALSDSWNHYCVHNSVFTHKTLEHSLFSAPDATDNNEVESWRIYPKNFHPSQPADAAIKVNYIAKDYSGHTTVCSITIAIPSKLRAVYLHLKGIQ